MKWFDADCMVGLPAVPMPDVQPDLGDLLSEMDRLGIDRALVRHRACTESAPEVGNALLEELIADTDRLVPLWHVTPDGRAGQWDPELMVDDLAECGVRAVWATRSDREVPYQLEPWAAGKMYGALEHHHLPLFLQHGDLSVSTLHSILEAHPDLIVVLLKVPRKGRNQPLYALMERHPNLHLCVSALYGVHRGLEDLCENFGNHRLVFGSAYPEVEGGASITALTYSDLDADSAAAIASGNLRRLLNLSE